MHVKLLDYVRDEVPYHHADSMTVMTNSGEERLEYPERLIWQGLCLIRVQLRGCKAVHPYVTSTLWLLK